MLWRMDIPGCVDQFPRSTLLDELFGGDNVTVEHADEVGVDLDLEIFLCAVKQWGNSCNTSIGYHNMEILEHLMTLNTALVTVNERTSKFLH